MPVLSLSFAIFYITHSFPLPSTPKHYRRFPCPLQKGAGPQLLHGMMMGLHRRRKGPPKGGNVSIVVTDIEGYSGVWEREKGGCIACICVYRGGGLR